MKFISFFATLSILLFGYAYGQCPNGGLNIQSDACEIPQNLKVQSVSCSGIKVAWTGGRDQKYILKISMIDPKAINNTKTKNWQVTTDELGNASVDATVKEGYHASWSVQSICEVDGARLYSAEVYGTEIDIPVCKKTTVIKPSNIVSVYPNPSKNYLLVEYKSKSGGPVALEVFSLSGTNLISRKETETAIANVKSTFQINISQLPPGTYLLKTANKKDGMSQVKFVKL